MKKANLVIALALVLITGTLGPLAHAQSDQDRPLYFGPEFTFKYENTYANFLTLIKRMQDHLVLNQPEQQKFENDGSEFTSPNGWSFYVSTDPGVVEITVNPMTVEEWEKFASDIQDAIFVSAANVGMFPQYYLGGGHISVDIAHFDNNPLLLRNFLADLINHNELFMGAFNYDVQNAASLFLYSPITINEVKACFKKFDFQMNKRNSENRKRKILNNFLVQLRDILYDGFPIFGNTMASSFRVQHEPTLDGSAAGRIEIRGIRPQMSAEMFVRQIRLLKGRIEFLKHFQKPIPIKAQVKVAEEITEMNDYFGYSSESINRSIDDADTSYFVLNPPVDPIEAIANFHRYVTESGEDWANHQDYLWPKWITDGDLEEFNASLPDNNCSNILDPQE